MTAYNKDCPDHDVATPDCRGCPLDCVYAVAEARADRARVRGELRADLWVSPEAPSLPADPWADREEREEEDEGEEPDPDAWL